MAVDFTDFTTGGTLASDNYLIGYDIDASGGEKKWKYDTLMRSISSDLTPELIHKINQNSGDGTVTSVTGTAPISVATGTTTPAISIAAATTSAAGTMSSTDKTRLDDASGVDGIVKCNSLGNFSAAVAGTDYLTSASSPVAKAWGLFDGRSPVSILSSYNINIAGFTRTARGQYRITFQTPMANTNYCVLVTSSVTIDAATGWNMPVYHTDAKTVNYIEINFSSSQETSVYRDSTEFSIAVFA
jgi:hypothetical protein